MRNLSIDVLKIILAFFVVFLHMQLLKDSYPLANYLSVNGLFRIAVPVFLIITGYYFYYIDNKVKLKKWLVRTFLLYIIWTFIYISYWKDDEILLTLLFGYHHLWYLIGTFFSGILLFILRNKSVKTLIILLIPLFLIGYVIQIFGNMHYFKGEEDSLLNKYFLYRNFLYVCFPFLTIGFLINKLKFDIAQYKYSGFLVVFSIFLVVLESFFTYKLIGSESADLLLSLLFACPLVFLYGKKMIIKTDSKILASFSTAIYLVHPLIMKSTYFIELKSFKTLIFLAVLVSLSFVLVFVNKKVKYLL